MKTPKKAKVDLIGRPRDVYKRQRLNAECSISVSLAPYRLLIRAKATRQALLVALFELKYVPVSSSSSIRSALKLFSTTSVSYTHL